MLVLIRGAGDIATGIALRLHRSGLQVVMTDLPRPTAIRRTVCFSPAITDGETTVEGVRAVYAPDTATAKKYLSQGAVPVLTDPELACRDALRPDALVSTVPAEFDVVEDNDFDIIRTKRFSVKPMTTDEAVLQMNLLGHSFYVFRNIETNAVCVVYHRNNGGYGLIETAE